MLRQEKLDYWIENNLNVLFIGNHGVGKTATIKEAFDRHNLNWLYYSTSTMDPWVDLVGVPKEVEVDGIKYLDLVRPKAFQYDEVEALFFDEYNRSPKKVRNAVMELIQFRSINGKKFNNLRMIWAAVNPEDEDYDVEKIDPAQLDRFQVQIKLPYECSKEYFNKKYSYDIASSAIEWWNNLPIEQKKLVSPRRLDYALEIYKNKGDLRDVLPESSNIAKLKITLLSGPTKDNMNRLFKSKNIEEAKKWIGQHNNFIAAIPYLTKNKEQCQFFLPLVSAELLFSKLHEKFIYDYISDNFDNYLENINSTIAANQNKAIVGTLTKLIKNKNKTAYFGKSNFIGNAVQIKNSLYNVQGSLVVKGLNIKPKCNVNIYRENVHKQVNWSTYERVKQYRLIRDNLHNNVDADEAIKTLQTISEILKRSQPTTINRMLEVGELISHLFNIINVSRPMTWNKFVDDNFDICRKIFYKIDNTKIKIPFARK